MYSINLSRLLRIVGQEILYETSWWKRNTAETYIKLKQKTSTKYFSLSPGLKVKLKMISLVAKISWGTPTRLLLLLQCGWLSARQMVHHSLLLLFKSKKTEQPEHICLKINHEFTRVTRLATCGGITDDRRSSLTQTSFIPRSVNIWNEKLPEILRA